MSKKLTKPQSNAIVEASLLFLKDQRFGGSGWFYPCWNHETAAVTCHPNTCKALCGLGLMEYNTIYYDHKNKPHNEYRISPAGLKLFDTIR